MITSTQNLVFENTQDINRTKKTTKRSNYMKSQYDNSNNVLTFEELLINNKDLCSIEHDEDQIKVVQPELKKKKEIKSYIANRDTLFIPYPEKPKRPIDISSRIIEEKPVLIKSEMGIQSDQINFVDKSKPFLPQKIGKDVGVQIEDGDLFNFDRDVQPLLTVLIGKILEQTDLELREEEEMKKIREAKAEILKRIKEDKLRIKKIEEEEIKLKKEVDNKKGLKLIEKNFKKNTQKKLMSKVFAKNFLRNFQRDTYRALTAQGLFIDHNIPLVKDGVTQYVFNEAERAGTEDEKVTHFIQDVYLNISLGAKNKHKNVIEQQRENLRQAKIDEEKRIQEEEERKISQKQERAEKRRLLKIKIFRDSIKKTILENPVLRQEAYASTEISEIDNNDNEGPFVGVLGGIMGIFINTISILKKNFYSQDSYYTAENISDVLNLYLFDGSNFNLFFNNALVEPIKQAMNNEEFDITQIKNSAGKINPEDWVVLHQILSPIENTADLFLCEFQQKLVDSYDKEFYSLIIKALLLLLEKSQLTDKINITFKQLDQPDITIEEKLSKFSGYCIINNSEKTIESIERLEYAKDTKKKKAFKVPDVDHERGVKSFQKTPEINVLFYDKKAEFITRNKILEAFLKLYHNKFEIEIDSKTIFKVFNEFYDAIMDSSDLGNKIQTFKFDIHDFVEEPAE